MMQPRSIRRAVVTGPTGAIGLALVKELLSHGIKVVAVCRPESTRKAALGHHPALSVVECDLDSLSSLPSLCPDKADVMFHFAWSATTGAGRNDVYAQTKNIAATLQAISVAKKMGCAVFIGAGSQAEYGRVEGKLTPDTPCRPENGYGMAKLAAGTMSRLLASQEGLDHIWVRILSVYGKGDTPASMISQLISSLKQGETPRLTAGDQLWDYLSAADAARAFLLLAQKGHGGKTYVLGGGKARPLKEYIKTVRDLIDPHLPLGLGEVPYAPLQVMHLEADITSLTEDTGFVPQCSFEEGIRNILEGTGN